METEIDFVFMEVIIDPRSSYAYGSFYINGLLQQYGEKNIHYSLSPFRELDGLGNDMRFLLKNGQQKTKVFLHLNDSFHIRRKDYQWCDMYGCVNTNFEHYPISQYSKLVSLVPSFGISLYGKWRTMSLAIRCFTQIWREVISREAWNKYTNQAEINTYNNIKHYFGRGYYKIWKNRLPLSTYVNDAQSENNYIFFLSTLWYSDEWNQNDEGVNLRRAHFIRACKSINNVHFDGGLLADKSSSSAKFADVLAEHGEPMKSWLEKTKRSAIVFNTPAFWDCHGWKLGEYLALGKCIVSTKLSNDLPHPLEHGVNIHFVENSEESMREAVEYILTHPDYRHKLEKGARKYWESYGTPEASLKLLGIE